MWTTVIGFVLKKAPFLGAAWVKPTLYALAAAGLMWSGWHAHSITDAAAQTKAYKAALTQQQAAYDAQHSVDLKQHDTDTKLIGASAAERDSIASERDQLLTATQGATLIKYVTKVVHDETGTHSCPEPVRADSYRLCYLAALDGTAESSAACKASGGAAAVPSEHLPPTG